MGSITYKSSALFFFTETKSLRKYNMIIFSKTPKHIEDIKND